MFPLVITFPLALILIYLDAYLGKMSLRWYEKLLAENKTGAHAMPFVSPNATEHVFSSSDFVKILLAGFSLGFAWYAELFAFYDVFAGFFILGYLVLDSIHAINILSYKAMLGNVKGNAVLAPHATFDLAIYRLVGYFAVLVAAYLVSPSWMFIGGLVFIVVLALFIRYSWSREKLPFYLESGRKRTETKSLRRAETFGVSAKKRK